ncbi:unnamed protein product [Coffea canephora]|uniref:Uncharacterized protein n=1 Tax=Coffea canephora TaxID=49390 RepID=A0A068UAF0_COFCA|nr:unnamed protein product [Coffea canephora]
MLLFSLEAERYDGSLIKISCRNSDMPGWKWVQELITGHPLRILENYRITVDNFMRLCDVLVGNNYVLQNPHKHVLIEEALGMTLVMLSHSMRTRVVGERFQHSMETIHRNVTEVLLGLCTLDGTHIPATMVPGFLALFKGGRNVRVGQGRGRSQVPKELFNTRHSQLRNIIERFFSVLKQRFAYLRGSVPYSYMQMQINFVITCCALHNFLRENQPLDDHFMMYEQERMQFEGECGGPPYPQIQPLTSPQEIEEWKGMREEMANQMHAASRRRK